LPLVGGWLRLRAVDRLARDDSPEAVRLLAEAVARTDDRRVCVGALEGLQEGTRPRCVEAVCEGWARTRPPPPGRRPGGGGRGPRGGARVAAAGAAGRARAVPAGARAGGGGDRRRRRGGRAAAAGLSRRRRGRGPAGAVGARPAPDAGGARGPVRGGA